MSSTIKATELAAMLLYAVKMKGTDFNVGVGMEYCFSELEIENLQLDFTHSSSDTSKLGVIWDLSDHEHTDIIRGEELLNVIKGNGLLDTVQKLV